MADVDNPDGVPVILVNKYNKTQELKRKIVHTKNGRIPLRDICNEWCLKADTVVWHDDGVSEPVKINPKDGYSDMGFSFINEIVLMGEVLGVNQAHQASKHMNDSFKSTGSTSKSTPKKPLDVEVTVETQQAHPNVVRTNAFSNLVKTVKEKPATSTTATPVVQQSTTTSATTSTYDKETQQHLDKLKSLYDNQILTEDEYNMKRKQIIDKAKEQQQQPKISTEQQDQITKLQSLLDKGILTQQEFDAKKKQVLGSSSSVPSTTSTSSVPKPTTTTTTSTPQTTGELVYDESKLTAQQKEQIAKIKAVREKGLLTKRDFEKKLREILEKK